MKLLLTFAAAICLPLSASGTLLTTNINMDNEFVVYISTSDSLAGTSFGTGNSWPATIVDSTTLTPGTDYYLHVRGRNYGGPAAFLGEFSLDSSDHVFSNGGNNLLTNTTDWQVNAIGFNGVYGTPTSYGINGVAPWANRAGVSASAEWIWTSPNGVPNQFNYFTTRISATNVPDGGSSIALLSLGIFGLLRLKRRLS